MTSDNKKAKADPAPKSDAAAKDKSTAGEAVSKTEGEIGFWAGRHCGVLPGLA
ncbi:MAG: hypothetical protein WA728_25140 [Xanthobacteraceae bacterium]